MKITVLTRYDFPYFGAAENLLRQLALGLDEHGAKVQIVRFSGDHHGRHNDTPIPVYNYLTKKKISQPILRVFVFVLKWFLIPIFVLRCKFDFKSDVLVLYGFDSAFMLAPLIFWCKLFGLKGVRFITEVYPEQYYARKWYQRPKIWLRAYQNKWIDRHFDGLVVLTTALRDLLLRNKVPSEKIVLIPHFINLNVKHEGISNTSKRFRIGFCGTAIELNGIMDLVDALFLLPESIGQTELVIIGKKTPALQRIVNNWKPNPLRMIFMTGKVKSTQKVHELLLECDVLVNPRKSGVSAETGFPTKVGEYFAARRPVVTTRCGDLVTYLEDKKHVVFAEPNDPRSLADAITFLFEHKDEADLIAQNGYEWACRELDYRTNSLKLLNWMQDRFGT